jgi:hypothetical protein
MLIDSTPTSNVTVCVFSFESLELIETHKMSQLQHMPQFQG